MTKVKEKATFQKSRIKAVDHKPLGGNQRVIIEGVSPEIDSGAFSIKKAVGEKVFVQADIFTDGHDHITAVLLFRKASDNDWQEAPMKPMGNDRFEGSFEIEKLETYFYTVCGWVDDFGTWRDNLKKKYEASQDVKVELMTGAQLLEEVAEVSNPSDKPRIEKWLKQLKGKNNVEGAVSAALSDELLFVMDNYPDKKEATTYSKELKVTVDREKALFSSWYELFPRSWAKKPGEHGTFKDCKRLLPEIKSMGFDTLYLPPIHPIGATHRKGKNNSVVCQKGEPGSPWAIGSDKGGHTAVHPQLGTIEDFRDLINSAKKEGIEIAMDIAYQCTPDHPYVKEHPQWFKWRPDGTIQYAENPPKKYQDIYPINFETDDWENLWNELKSVFLFWIGQGVRIFRVDNPHTKPFRFWDWVIQEIKRDYPDTIFLAEAFTRPKVMKRLAKGGFTQSYTYFTWRNTKHEFTEYMRELTQTDMKEYFRPNFWTNTPDILPEHLQYGGRPAYIMRLVLAATLSSNYGIYGPAFELCVSEAVPGKEEYLNSEKYEIKKWDWDKEGNLKELIARINQIRKENPALQTTWNIKMCEIDNDQILCYYKATEDLSNILLIVVNLDPHHTQSGWVQIPLEELGIDPNQAYLTHDLLSDDRYIWQGKQNYVELNPQFCPAHILKLRRKTRREQDFDYYM